MSVAASVAAELRACVDAGNAAIDRDDARGWTDAMDDPQIVIAGEGLARPVSGAAAALALAEDILASCAMAGRVVEIVTADGSGDLAYTWVRFVRSDRTDPVGDARALHVWRRGPAGWRVVADMHQGGGMPPRI